MENNFFGQWSVWDTDLFGKYIYSTIKSIFNLSFFVDRCAQYMYKYLWQIFVDF